MQQSAIFWNKAAEKYAKSPIDDIDAYNYTLDRSRSYLSAEDRVLELGCGTGSTALILANEVGHVTASDLSVNMIDIARRKARDQRVDNIDFVTADLFDDAFEGAPFDAILALNLLHLIEDTPAALRRINGLLKPGGMFISKTVCQIDGRAPLKFRLMKFLIPLMQMLGKAPYVKFLAIDEWEQILTREGFQTVEAGNFPPPSRYIVAKKL